MSWEINSRVDDLLKKGSDLIGLETAEAEFLLHLEPGSREIYALMETANAISRKQFGNKGERHFHIGINIEPCPFNCAFCSLTEAAGSLLKKYPSVKKTSSPGRNGPRPSMPMP